MPGYATELDVDSVTDLDPEFTIQAPDPADGTLALDNSQAPVLVNVDDVNNIYTFRYWTVGTFADGDVDIDFIGNSFDYLDISGEAIGNFADQGATVLDDDGVLYVVVEFGASLTLDTGSVDTADVTASRTADDGAGAVTLSNITERGPPGSYRVDVTAAGLAAGDAITLQFAASGDWTYNGQNAVVETTRLVSVGNFTYIDIRFHTAGDIALDTATINGDEFTLAGTGLGSAVPATAPEDQPTQLGDDNVFRYYFSRGFTSGSVALTFVAGSWQDAAGNTGSAKTESFQIIEALQDDGSDGSQGGDALGKIFYIEISGGVKLEGLGFLDEPIIDIRGRVVLEIGRYELPSGGTVARFSVDASGTIKIVKLGNIGSVAARFVLQAGDTVSGLPELWGVAKIQANLDFLKNYGIFAEGSAMLQINTTPSVKTEKISLEGIPGDPIAEGLTFSISAFSTSVLGEVEASADLKTLLQNEGITDDLEGAIVQTVIVGQKWKIITAGGPVYFLEYNSTSGTVDLSTEAQTFVLPAQSFSIEIVGSLQIKENGSSDKDADNWVELNGGFFLRITPERFEIFVTANANIPILGLAGKATGLLIVDGRLPGPGIRGSPCCSTWNSPSAAARRTDRPTSAVRFRPWTASSNSPAKCW